VLNVQHVDKGSAENGLQHLLFQWLFERKMDGKIVLQDVEGLNTNDHSFKRKEFVFIADWQDYLQSSTQQKAGGFLSGDTDDKGDSTRGDINDLGTESAADRRVDVGNRLHLNFARQVEPLLFAAV
jgi:hypothetical protein